MRFLAFEGLDGSGKSTLMNGLASKLDRRGQSFVRTREPGGTALGDDVRNLLLRDGAEVPRPRAELLLYQAGRAQHVDLVIKPALARGDWVLSDRFAASSLAFQAGGRVIDRADVAWLNNFSTNGLEPDLYVLLDLTVEESGRRRRGRAGAEDRFERERAEFHERVRAEYHRLAADDPGRWLTLDAARPADEVLDQLIRELGRRQWLG